jgi:hypothetical protein
VTDTKLQVVAWILQREMTQDAELAALWMHLYGGSDISPRALVYQDEAKAAIKAAWDANYRATTELHSRCAALEEALRKWQSAERYGQQYAHCTAEGAAQAVQDAWADAMAARDAALSTTPDAPAEGAKE